MSSSSKELEVKIDISPDDLERVFAHLSASVRPRDIQHKYRPRQYFDTDNLDLHRNGTALRVQYKPGAKGYAGTYEQTVKVTMDCHTPGALLRKECKDAIPTGRPDMSAVSDRKGREAVAPFVDCKLSHIFTAAVERRFFDLRIRDKKKKTKAIVEVAFDVGYLSLPSGQSEAFCEIEIELKKGKARALKQVKKEILKLAPSARVQAESKADHGVTLYLRRHSRLPS